MKRYWVPALLAVGAVLVLCLDGDAGWRRRHCPPCAQYRPPCIQYPRWIVIRPHDKRLETDKRDIPESTEEVPSAWFAPFDFAERAWKEPDADTFTVRRHHRGRAKTTFADAPLEVFADLRALILSLPDDEEMTALTKKAWDFDRIDKEQRNVRVTAYLFAIAKERDNDYHLIIDDDGNLEEGAKLNVEISGIPTEGPDVESLRQVRAAFKAYFDGSPPRKYQPFLDPPVRVVIEGSLFFDRDHPSGEVGPQGYRPASAWEIHPVRSIQFLEN
jgi:hypothetical protein